MKRQGSPRPREDGRHWLPSQGVDPAPLAELNSECLGHLVMRAAESDSIAAAPPLLAALHAQWAALPAHAVRRLSAAPFSLFDAGFALAPRWLELRTRGVHDLSQRGELAYFDSARRALHHAPHARLRLAPRTQPAASRLPGFRVHHRGRRVACSLFAGRARSRRRSQRRCFAAALVEPVWFLARIAVGGVGRRRPSAARTTSRRCAAPCRRNTRGA